MEVVTKVEPGFYVVRHKASGQKQIAQVYPSEFDSALMIQVISQDTSMSWALNLFEEKWEFVNEIDLK